MRGRDGLRSASQEHTHSSGSYIVALLRRRGEITQIKRSTVTALLDKIVLRTLRHEKIGKPLGGSVTADATLAALSKLFNWHASRSDDFVSPIVRGMRRAKPPMERARQRVLSDDELRVMWPILGDMGVFGASVRCMLLTAQRVRKVARMRRQEISKRSKDCQPPHAPCYVAESGVGHVVTVAQEVMRLAVGKLEELDGLLIGAAHEALGA
jgi:hypothetical protein